MCYKLYLQPQSNVMEDMLCDSYIMYQAEVREDLWEFFLELL